MEVTPWLTVDAVKFIEDNFDPTDTVFEWGSGGSTLWFAERVKHVTSVEHDIDWYMKLVSDIPSNMRLIYAPPDGEYQEGHEGTKGKTFKTYASVIDPVGPFDWVMIDGRARVACARHAINKFRRFLVLDDAHRDRYEEIIDMMEKHECEIFPGPFAYGKGEGETRIWRYTPQR